MTNDLYPIPGVRYLVSHPKYDEGLQLLYAPWEDKDYKPWVDSRGIWFNDEEVKVIRAVYNPHPPTRTEYGCPEGDHIRPTSKERALAFAQSPPACPPYQRQVTDWKKVEVDDA